MRNSLSGKIVKKHGVNRVSKMWKKFLIIFVRAVLKIAKAKEAGTDTTHDDKCFLGKSIAKSVFFWAVAVIGVVVRRLHTHVL